MVCFHLGVKGVKVLVVVCHKLFKHLFFRFNTSVGHFVIPFFQKGNAFSGTHFAKDEGDFDFI